MSRSRQRCELVVSYTPADIIAQKNPSRGSSALLVLFDIFAALTSAGDAFKVHKFRVDLCAPIRQPHDEIVNLGPLHAWRPPGADRYALGIVRTRNDGQDRDWEQLIAQLKALGWTIVKFGDNVSAEEKHTLDLEIARAAALAMKPKSAA